MRTPPAAASKWVSDGLYTAAYTEPEPTRRSLTHINRYHVTGTTAEESGGEIRGRTGPDHNKAEVKLDGAAIEDEDIAEQSLLFTNRSER